MSKKIFKYCFFIILAIVQVTLVPIFEIGGIWPNLILIFSIIFLLLGWDEDAIILAGLGGLLLDLATTLTPSINTLLLIALIFSIKYISRKFISEVNTIIVFLTLFLASCFYALVFIVISHHQISLSITFEGIFNAIIGEALFIFLNSKTHETILKIE